MRVSANCRTCSRDRTYIRPVAILAVSIALCVLHPSKGLTEDKFWSDSATGLAIGGFDPVSYFTQSEPLEGTPEYEVFWSGSYWQFANEGNMAAFKRDPAVYAPQFGGHGTIAVGNGVVAPGKPRIWHIWEGKLFFFHNEESRKSWLGLSQAERHQLIEDWKEKR